MPSIDISELSKGNRRELAKAITLIEDERPEKHAEANALLGSIQAFKGRSIRIAITGIPGAGKSTFIEHFGLHLVGQGKKVAVLAVDPSSPLSGGSILGDKTRMEKLSNHSSAYIRPSPNRGTLGGVTKKTREVILLCEAAGYDYIFIETVGVGQSELEVVSMTDLFLLLTVPNTGDELQGIKRGIMEVANIIIVNKADGHHYQEALNTQAHIKSALSILPGDKADTLPVMLVSAMENKGIDEVYKEIQRLLQGLDLAGLRARQDMRWFKDKVMDWFEQEVQTNPQLTSLWKNYEAGILGKRLGALEAANLFVQDFKKTMKAN